MKIGGYYSTCCVLDLYRVETEQDIADIRNADPEDGMMYFNTLDEAIAYLRPDMGDPDEAAAVKRLRGEGVSRSQAGSCALHHTAINCKHELG